MPVECSVPLTPIGQERFHALDKIVMRHAFDIHNSIGRFFDERIYRDELAIRCGIHGLECDREVEITVSHQNFSKSYFIDLIVERGTLYELKAAESFSPTHQSQLLNYLLLCGSKHGKILNFRPSSVQSRFVSTTLTPDTRKPVTLTDTPSLRDDPLAQQLKHTLLAILDDWGAFLEVNLYRDALLHFTTGPNTGIQPVEIHTDGRIVGLQKMCLLDSNRAWHLSSIKSNTAAYETHLNRLLRHTSLASMVWINLNQNHVTLNLIQK